MPDDKDKSVTELLDEEEGKDSEETPNEGEEEGKTTPKDKVKNKKEDEEESEVPDEETENALETYRLLNDPVKGPKFIQNLAQEYGLSLQDASKKSENKIKAALKDKLGDKFSEDHEVLGDILETIVFGIRNELKSEFERESQERSRRELQGEFANFVKQNKITAKEADKLDTLMKDMPPNPKRPVSLTSYLTNLLKIVRPSSPAINARRRVEENSNRRVENLSSDVSEKRIKIGSARPTIKEAVRAASMNIRFNTSEEED